MESKPQPHDLQAEKAVIGGLFINPGAIAKVRKDISPDDFYREAHEHIARALFELKEKSDIVTISDALKSKELLERCGGMDYLASLIEMTSTSAGIEHHCRIIKNFSVRRNVIDQCSVTADQAFNLTVPISETLSEIKAEIRAMNSNQGKDYKPNEELVKSVLNDIEARSKSGDRFVGVKTGFENIDSDMHGMGPRDIHFLIARPSVGKTALAISIAVNVAMNHKGNVIYYTLESNKEALMRRLFAAHSGIFLSRLRTGNVDDYQWPNLIKTADILSKNNLIIIDKSRYKKIENLVSMTESLAMEGKISLIVVDHIQRMRSRKKFQSRHLELSYISEELSTLAKELNVPILILCQLNRAVEGRRDKRPRLFDMKESGDLEQNADTVIGLYRDSRDSEIMETECLKGRDTGTWKTTLNFDRYTQKITDCSEDEQEPIQRYSRGFDG